MVILHTHLLQLFLFFFTLFFDFFQSKVDFFFLFLFHHEFYLFVAVSLVQATLVLSYFLEFLLLRCLHFHADHFLCFVLFKHDLIQFLFLLFFDSHPCNFLFFHLLDLSVNDGFFFKILLSCFSFKMLSIDHLRM